MNFPEIQLDYKRHLSITRFKEMDYLTTSQYEIPIELMMENAGLQLARLVAIKSTSRAKVLIGIGPGNNGGGGLVAARRLASWGYDVWVNMPNQNLQPLPQTQMKRALKCGVEMNSIEEPDIFVDAYLGFSQRLPLSDDLQHAIDEANNYQCTKISLDLPTGFNMDSGDALFRPDTILTLAAMKTELIPLLDSTNILIADLGIPMEVYNKFGIEQPIEFKKSGIVRMVR